jgi:hypothetical protein
MLILPGRGFLLIMLCGWRFFFSFVPVTVMIMVNILDYGATNERTW